MDVVSKKITLLISSLAGGGAEGVCVSVANGLADNGWQVNLVVLHTNNAAYLERVSPKVNLVVLGVNHARNVPLPLLRYIRKHKPAKLLVFNYELAVIAVMLRSVFRLKTKIIARNINTFSQNTAKPQGSWQRYIVKPLINHFYGKADHIINQCQAMRDDLVSVFPHLADKTSVIYNPVSKHVEDYAKTHDLTQVVKRDYLLCVGRLEKQKAFHYAIEGFAGIANDFPSLRLKIVGQGSLEQSLKQCAIDLGVADRVDFEGFQADMIPYYLHAKLTLLTSLYEGFPNVLIESITLGTPVIAFDCPSGPREIIQEGVNGYLVDYQSVSALETTCRTFLNKPIDSKSVQFSASRYLRNNVIKIYLSLLIIPHV
ncbi:MULTISPECIES: glycosyltransferase [unclassified Shewanella]|uniref:glycosyltransferase n=1 Tax=unclassified Shewanella TaxID=196818 RepID=UPI0021DA97D5|nr:MULTISPECIES: glycosyltransferase [unclassified Shewanella]MCU7961485.1 glycosyltransferase [Shewanella sp. SW32]MCU7969567.1 glycosyltransferase [Shewanella sp. SW29]MCU8001462.1 glycosyltransferase [Shewanella sp. SM96]MCU8059850.1 glycosyltransferase [Shewanella sp. SM55]